MASDVVLFIDANQYLKLYGMVAGKQLLGWLEEQQAHIFVSAQIVDEVVRNKLGYAQRFLLDKLELDVTVPDHLLGISGERINELRQNIKKSADELTTLADDVLFKISRSEDDVSQRLRGLFDKANPPLPDQMERARDRKERGNPPGKQDDPLGDQITWEQLLTYSKGMKQLWIITDDRDYGIKHGKKMLLNSLLRGDLMNACGVELEIHYYNNWSEGITDFRKNVGVTTDKLPTPAQIEEIKKEEETLPPRPLDWMFTGTDAALAAHRQMQRRRQRVFFDAQGGLNYFLEPGQGGGGFSGHPGVVGNPPTDPKK
jgi:hypothetical protein